MNRILEFFGRNINHLLLKDLKLSDKIFLKLFPRNKAGEITVYNQNIRYTDKYSFLAIYKELFIREIYAFKAKTNTPLIIDCGANIGLSVIYFKKLYPNARIVAFEPDQEIFGMLQDNIGAFNFTDVSLKQETVWVNNDVLHFQSQGGLSGQITGESSGEHIISVKGFRLKELLNQAVDFLKIDIEGAEYEVLKDCKDLLQNVSNLFVEYNSRSDNKQRLDEILTFFSQSGFRYQIHEAFVSKNPYLKIDRMLDMDLQLNIFGYRE